MSQITKHHVVTLLFVALSVTTGLIQNINSLSPYTIVSTDYVVETGLLPADPAVTERSIN